jgi:hypothetical protein
MKAPASILKTNNSIKIDKVAARRASLTFYTAENTWRILRRETPTTFTFKICTSILAWPGCLLDASSHDNYKWGESFCPVIEINENVSVHPLLYSIIEVA